MVVTTVSDPKVVRKLRNGVATGVALAEQRQKQIWSIHYSRLAARRKSIATRSSKWAEIAQQRQQRRMFFERYSLRSLNAITSDKSAYTEYDVDTKRFINTAFGINAKKLNRMDMLKYMSMSGRFPTMNMKRRYDALGRKETKRHFARLARQARIEAKASNIFNALRVYRCKAISSVLSEELLPLGPARTFKRSRDFNPKQNFVYRSKHEIIAHPYYGLSMRARLHHATVEEDIPQINLIQKYRIKLEAMKIAHAISYRNSFKRYALKTYNHRILDLIDQFNTLGVVKKTVLKALNHSKPSCAEQVRYSDLYAHAEMENDDAHGEGTLTQTITQNVILTDGRDASSAPIERVPRWHRMNTEDVIGNFTEMVDRWYILDNFKWEPNLPNLHQIKKYHLPNYVLTQSRFNNLISVRPFFNHRLWRGDMQIKIEVNSNKFQFGQLQCSFYYGFDYMTNKDVYENPYTLSQANHVLIDAGGSNNAIINIPYRNQSVMIGTSQVGSIPSAYVGTLFIYVLNKLEVTPDASQYADVTINFKFSNCEFSGQIAADLSNIKAMPQMDALMMAGAMRLLDTVAGDPNRDNPPGVATPAYIVPTAIHSMSLGTDYVEPTNPLRLSQRGQTHHPNVSFMDSRNTVTDIVRTFGLLQQPHWTSSIATGSGILHMGVSPDILADSQTSSGYLTKQYSVPLMVLSNLFMQWRGSIEFRFDIIASQFHTGRILAAFVPMNDRAITLNQAMSSYNAQFDLQESRSFTFVIPFVHIDAWMRRHAQMDGESTQYTNYGTLSLFVLNRLTHPATVTDNVTINVYMRAGDSFELSVPIQPSVGLSFETRVFTESSSAFSSDDGQDDYYVGQWAGKGIDEALVARWGTLAGRVITFNNIASWVKKSKQHQYFEDGTRITVRGKNSSGGEISYDVSVWCIVQVDNTWIAVACKTPLDAATLHNVVNVLRHPYATAINNAACLMHEVYTQPWTGGKMVLKRKIMATAEGERDMNVTTLDASRNLLHSNHGQFFYGESFSSLLDLCRRYQYYGRFAITTDNDSFGPFQIVRFPIKPAGLPLALGEANKVNLITNKCRDGIIPIILSGFKYYRGSIRFRIVFTSNDIPSCVWVQHRPECTATRSVEVGTSGTDSMNMFGHGYASAVQMAVVNGMVEFEAPYYQPGMFGLLGETNSDSLAIYGTNGTIVLGMTKAKAYSAIIFYALADDFSFSLFQGFPQIVNPADVVVKNEPRVNFHIENTFEDDINSTIDSMEKLDLDEWLHHCDIKNKAIPQAPTPTIEKPKTKPPVPPKTPFLGRMLGVDQIRENISSTLTESVNDVIEKFKTEGIWRGGKHFLLFVISHLAHVIANFSIKTLVVAIVAIMGYIGVQCYDKATVIARFIRTVFRKFFPEQSELLMAQEEKKKPNNDSDIMTEPHIMDFYENEAYISKEQCEADLDKIYAEPGVTNQQRRDIADQWATTLDDSFPPTKKVGHTKRAVHKIMKRYHAMKARPQADDEDDVKNVAGWFSLCFTALSTAVGCHEKGIKFNTKKAAEDFMNAKHFRGGNTIFTFVKLNYETLLSMYRFIRYKMEPGYMLSKIFLKDSSAGSLWLNEVRDILSTSLSSKDSFNPVFADRVAISITIGHSIANTIAKSKVTELIKESAGIDRKIDSLHKVQESLRRRGQYSFKRPKPLHVQFCGKPGKGKTVLTDHISDYILTEVCELQSIPMNKICTVKACSKFWDQCTGTEPVVLLDDLWACIQPEILVSQVMNYIELYGDTIFSPPKAVAEEKDMRYAPELILSTTNHPYRDLPGIDPGAIFRRRDLLIEVIDAPLDPEGHPACPHCKGESIGIVSHRHLEDFHHVVFQLMEPEEVNTKHHRYDTPISYSRLLSVLERELTPIHKKNKDMYKESVARAIRNCGDDEIQTKQPLYQNAEDFEKEFKREINNRYSTLSRDFSSFKTAIGQRMEDSSKALKAFFSRANKYKDTAKPEADNEEIGDLPEQLKPYKKFIKPALLEMMMKFTKLEVEFLELCAREAHKEMERGKVPKNLNTTFIMDFILKSKINHPVRCLHTKQEYFEGYIENGTWYSAHDDRRSIGPNACQQYCILNGAFCDEYCQRWLDFTPTRRINHRNRISDRIPAPLSCAKQYNTDKTRLKKMRDAISNFIDSQKLQDSALYKALKVVKYIIKTCFKIVTKWLPILILIVGGVTSVYGITKAWGICSGSNDEYNKMVTETGKIAADAAAKLEGQFDAKAIKKWQGLYQGNLMNRALHKMSNKEFVEGGKYHHQLPTPLVELGMPALPQYNHYAGEIKRVPVTATKQPIPRMATAQAGVQQLSVAERLYRDNTLYITSVYINENGFVVKNRYTCLQLRGQQMLSLRHYWEKWLTNPPETQYYLHYAEKKERLINAQDYGIPIDILSCTRYKMCYEFEDEAETIPANDCNWDIVELPKTWQMCKDITKFFAKRSQHEYVTGSILFIRPEDYARTYPLKRNPHRVIMEAIPGGVELTMNETYLYDQHAPGFCGSAILALGLQRPIIGIHVAEWNAMGCAEPIYGDMFSETPTLTSPITDICEMQLLDVDLADINIDTVVYPKGVVPSIMATQQSGETQFVPSIAQGEIYAVETEPMPLTKHDKRMQGKDPMQLGVNKHGMVPLDFPAKHLQAAKEDLQNKILAYSKPVRSRVEPLNLQTAICGDCNIPEFTALNWSSSEGFPLINMRPKDAHSKAYLFKLKNPADGTGYKLEGLHPELLRLLSTELAMRKAGIRCDTINIDCLKDEVREIAKARTPGKTRVFSTCPVQYVIAYRQWFGDFNAAYKSNRILNEHAVGINCDGPEWTNLAYYLQEKGKYIIAGDYSHFGYTLNANVMGAAFDIMLAWYDKYATEDDHFTHQVIRRVLASESINVKRLCRNLVYQSLCGLSSGFPATDVLNSMVNCLYVRMAWIGITNKPLSEFNKHCNVIVYGDDLLINVSNEYIDQFNTQTMFEYFAKYDIKFTDCDKSGNIVAKRTLDNAPFLKRSFIKHPTRPRMYLAQIDVSSIGSCLNWVIRKDDAMEAFVTNCRAALNLAYGHGPQYYEKLRKEITDVLQDRNQHFVSSSWHEFDSGVYNDAK